MSAISYTEERQKDERDLFILQLWDDPNRWSAGEIAKALGITRNIVIAQVDRVDREDPEALRRKPKRKSE